MSNSQTIEALKERIKELSCLYDISNLATKHSNSLTDSIQAIVERVAQAWRYPKYAVAEIELGTFRYFSSSIPYNTVRQEAQIFIEGQLIGCLKIYYPSPDFVKDDFLPEEQQLLTKVAQEIAILVERHERNEREELLKRSVERNDRLSILGEITAGIAHELNTPLANILGFSELIANTSKEDQVKKDVAKITTSAMHAREVVKKLMFFSCEMPQQMQSIALNPLVEDALKLLMPAFENADVKLHFIPDPKNSFGQMDPIQMTQVVFNLVINAIHASQPGSSIQVKLSSINKRLNLTVEDQGHGIPEAIREKIFEPFFTTKGVGEGSGLGLSVVHGIVKSHNGQIRFSTELEVGTTVHVSLPLHP